MIEEVSLAALIRIFHKYRVDIKIVPLARFNPMQVVEIIGMIGDEETDERMMYSLDGQIIFQNTSDEWKRMLNNVREEIIEQRKQGLVG
jgi:hypothetical protein